MRYLILCAAIALVSGCGGAATQTLARGVDRACEEFNANPLTSLPLRKQAVGAVNLLTTQGNHTASDCDNDGMPDFDIDANGQPIP